MTLQIELCDFINKNEQEIGKILINGNHIIFKFNANSEDHTDKLLTALKRDRFNFMLSIYLPPRLQQLIHTDFLDTEDPSKMVAEYEKGKNAFYILLAFKKLIDIDLAKMLFSRLPVAQLAKFTSTSIKTILQHCHFYFEEKTRETPPESITVTQPSSTSASYYSLFSSTATHFAKWIPYSGYYLSSPLPKEKSDCDDYDDEDTTPDYDSIALTLLKKNAKQKEKVLLFVTLEEQDKVIDGTIKPFYQDILCGNNQGLFFDRKSVTDQFECVPETEPKEKFITPLGF